MSVNTETYEVPTLALLAALIAVFAALYLQGRAFQGKRRRPDSAPTVQHRHLLWLVGWSFAVLQVAAQIAMPQQPGIALAVSRTCMQLAALMFLGSLAPQYMTEKPRVLYVVAFGAPLIAYDTLLSLDPQPGELVHGCLVACALGAVYVATRWSLVRQLLPQWVSLLLVGCIGTACVWLTLRQEYAEVLVLVHSGVLLMAALLFVAEFRRLTTGVVFTVGGLALWALPAMLHPMLGAGPLPVGWQRAVNLVKVLTAGGMIVLVLEDELALNAAAQQRDRRARFELEKYTSLYLGNMPFGENKEEYNQICGTIVLVSRFRQAAIFLQGPERNFRLMGQSGMDGALEGALDALARRTTEQKTEEVAGGSHFEAGIGNLTLMDLSPLMEPGDELKQMSFRKVHVMGIRARDGRLLGALMLTGVKQPEEPLQTEDVLPLELLATRLGAAREQQVLLHRLLQSEKLAGLGQLAGGVAHELNNPLTAVSGFAELLTESEDAKTREHAEVIVHEARRMKQIVESLLRFRRATPGERVPVSIELMLTDIEKLSQRELKARRIQLHLKVAEDLPRVRVDSDQIRQVFLQLTRNAITSLEETPPGWERKLTIEACLSRKMLQVMFCDSGPGFADPTRAFDPYFTTRHPGEGMGLGLSICYSIIREHGGELSAANLDPHGAVVVIELPVDEGESAPAEGNRLKRLFADEEQAPGM